MPRLPPHLSSRINRLPHGAPSNLNLKWQKAPHSSSPTLSSHKYIRSARLIHTCIPLHRHSQAMPPPPPRAARGWRRRRRAAALGLGLGLVGSSLIHVLALFSKAAYAFQQQLPAPQATAPPRSLLPALPAPPTAAPCRTTALASSFFDPFSSSGCSNPFDALTELTSALGGSLRAGTPVYIGDLGRMGAVVGREIDGQYLIQVPSGGGTPVVSESVPLITAIMWMWSRHRSKTMHTTRITTTTQLVRRPGRLLFVQQPGSPQQQQQQPRPPAAAAPGWRFPAQEEEAEEQQQQWEGVEEGGDSDGYQLYQDPRTGKTYVVYQTRPQARWKFVHTQTHTHTHTHTFSLPLSHTSKHIHPNALSHTHLRLSGLLRLAHTTATTHRHPQLGAGAGPQPVKRLRMAPPRDQLQEYLAAQQRRREERARWQAQQQQPPAPGGMPGSEFVTRAFEDALRALDAGGGGDQGQRGRREEDQFDLLTRLAEVL